MRTKISVVLAVIIVGLALIAVPALAAEQKKPNIVIIWGDDIGYWNISAYNQGMMGYKTPNIDRIGPTTAPRTSASSTRPGTKPSSKAGQLST